MWVKLSESDVRHILDLIRLNEDEGTFINGRNRWRNKSKRIQEKLINK